MDLDHLANVSAFGKQVVRQIVAITIPRSVSLCIGTYATRVKAGVSDEAARRLTWTVGVAQRVAAAVVARSVAAIARSVLCGRRAVGACLVAAGVAFQAVAAAVWCLWSFIRL